MRSIKKYLSLVLILSILMSSFSFAYGYSDLSIKKVMESNSNEKNISENSANGETLFFENKGLHDKSVDYYVNAIGGTLFYSKKGETTFVVPLETSVTEDAEEGVYLGF